jgi:hypothetical protein
MQLLMARFSPLATSRSDGREAIAGCAAFQWRMAWIAGIGNGVRARQKSAFLNLGEGTKRRGWCFYCMRHYTERDLEHCERLVAETRDRVIRQQALIDNLTSLGTLEEACSLLDQMTETLALHEQERIRILEALTK